MNEHFIVAVDHGRFRIYTEANAVGCFLPRMQLVKSAEIGLNRDSFQDRALVVRPRVRTSSPQPATAGATRPRRDGLRRMARQLATQLDAFLRDHPGASWDLAAAPAFGHAVMEALSADVSRRLKRVYSSQPVSESPDRMGLQLAIA